MVAEGLFFKVCRYLHTFFPASQVVGGRGGIVLTVAAPFWAARDSSQSEGLFCSSEVCNQLVTDSRLQWVAEHRGIGSGCEGERKFALASGCNGWRSIERVELGVGIPTPGTISQVATRE